MWNGGRSESFFPTHCQTLSITINAFWSIKIWFNEHREHLHILPSSSLISLHTHFLRSSVRPSRHTNAAYFLIAMASRLTIQGWWRLPHYRLQDRNVGHWDKPLDWDHIYRGKLCNSSRLSLFNSWRLSPSVNMSVCMPIARYDSLSLLRVSFPLVLLIMGESIRLRIKMLFLLPY